MLLFCCKEGRNKDEGYVDSVIVIATGTERTLYTGDAMQATNLHGDERFGSFFVMTEQENEV
jgi:hypothetical protein